MSENSHKWYETLIAGQVRERNKVRGSYLDETMVTGDEHAGVIKFPVVSGTIEVYKVSGAIQPVKTSNATLDTVPIQTDEYEASTYIKTRDLRKQGPNEQAAVSREISKAIAFKKDKLKLDAVAAFAEVGSPHLTDGPTTVETIGDGTTRIDLIDMIEAASRIFGTGIEEGVYWPIPEVFMDQLEMYKEFANADYIGSKDLPFARMDNVRKRTFRRVHIMTLPDKYFYHGTGAFGAGEGHLPFSEDGYLDTFMWCKEAMGAQMDWYRETVEVREQFQLEGSPLLAKAGLDGAAIGVLPEMVKRLRFKAQNRAVRPEPVAAP